MLTTSATAISSDQPVLVAFHAPSRTALAFDPRHKGRALDFEPAEIGEEQFTLKDRQTQSIWWGFTGKCLSGPSRGSPTIWHG